MFRFTKKTITQTLLSFSLLFGSVGITSSSFAQQNTARPTPSPGMSEYQPVQEYTSSMTATQSDSVTSKKGPGLPGSTPSQSPNRPYNGPSINIPGTGIRAYFDAPVSPPYNAAASYDTYAGQPGGNRNAILQQSVGDGY
ncbi:unnamed protein product [Commensalibacter communis]|uniref:hypothetical protein n=1 Tax=Commensalibacter communis TaxID=2972786 RepID=UPI0022FF9B59|nr:hypothetical protein [Commensalibacter communis]CAI3925204.1 unnamed protein product [Commensalibacter communis]CAI3934135.1 unnamed protein product [Commensalibacter communis]